MSLLVTLLLFTLPMLAAAVESLNETNLYTLFPAVPVGDVLNVTQCYCDSPTSLSPDAIFGYYYRFDYYNYHLNRTYSIPTTCTSSNPDHSNGTKPAKCLDHISKLKKSCTDYTDGNRFCYKFKEDVDNWDHSKPSGSKFWFNDQKRRVPAHASEFLTENEVTENCAFYCNEKLGGLTTIEKPSSLIPGVGPVTNNAISYSDLDDMCPTCAV